VKVTVTPAAIPAVPKKAIVHVISFWLPHLPHSYQAATTAVPSTQTVPQGSSVTVTPAAIPAVPKKPIVRVILRRLQYLRPKLRLPVPVLRSWEPQLSGAHSSLFSLDWHYKKFISLPVPSGTREHIPNPRWEQVRTARRIDLG